MPDTNFIVCTDEPTYPVLEARNLIASQDYNAWRATLESIIAKHGYSTSSVPGYIGGTVEGNSPSLSSNIGNMQNDIIKTTQALPYIPNINDLPVGIWSPGYPTLLETKTKIEEKLSEMNAICPHNSHRSNDSDRSDRSHDYSDYYTNCPRDGCDSGRQVGYVTDWDSDSGCTTDKSDNTNDRSDNVVRSTNRNNYADHGISGYSNDDSDNSRCVDYPRDE